MQEVVHERVDCDQHAAGFDPQRTVSISGEQQVRFDPAEDGVEIELALRYRIKKRSPLTPLIDVLFVRRLMVTSLEKTLGGFGAVLAASRHSGVG